MHYFAGIPFKRLEALHQGWGVPLPDANLEPLPSGGGAAVPGAPEGALRAATAAPMPAVAALGGQIGSVEFQ